MKHRLAFKAGAETDIHHLVVAGQQGRGRAGHPLAPQPRRRRQMGVIAEQVGQLGEADAGGAGQRAGVGEIFRCFVNTAAKPSKRATFSSSPR